MSIDVKIYFYTVIKTYAFNITFTLPTAMLYALQKLKILYVSDNTLSYFVIFYNNQLFLRNL